MNLKYSAVEYRPCTKCKIRLAKVTEDICKNCKFKVSFSKSNSNTKYKIYMPRFSNRCHKNIKSYIDDNSDHKLGIYIYNSYISILSV
jgi:hypothetical protein